jgi:uncharacterized membrane protein (UPF0127 family)
MSKRSLLALVVVAAVLLVAPVLGQEYSEFGNLLTRLAIRGVPVTAEVPEDRGMLFSMSNPGLHAFCMRDMRFPIDIIWIADGKVAGMSEHLSQSYPGVVTPPVPVRLVLEVPGGFAERHGIKVGDPVVLKLSDEK